MKPRLFAVEIPDNIRAERFELKVVKEGMCSLMLGGAENIQLCIRFTEHITALVKEQPVDDEDHIDINIERVLVEASRCALAIMALLDHQYLERGGEALFAMLAESGGKSGPGKLVKDTVLTAPWLQGLVRQFRDFGSDLFTALPTIRAFPEMCNNCGCLELIEQKDTVCGWLRMFPGGVTQKCMEVFVE